MDSDNFNAFRTDVINSLNTCSDHNWLKKQQFSRTQFEQCCSAGASTLLFPIQSFLERRNLSRRWQKRRRWLHAVDAAATTVVVVLPLGNDVAFD